MFTKAHRALRKFGRTMAMLQLGPGRSDPATRLDRRAMRERLVGSRVLARPRVVSSPVVAGSKRTPSVEIREMMSRMRCSFVRTYLAHFRRLRCLWRRRVGLLDRYTAQVVISPWPYPAGLSRKPASGQSCCRDDLTRGDSEGHPPAGCRLAARSGR